MSSSEDLPTTYQNYIHLSKYSRWREDLGRRETWPETGDRYLDFWTGKFPGVISRDDRAKLRAGLLGLSAVPSMRCLMTAGPALMQDEAAGYNPVSGDTLVLTMEHGLVPIETLDGEDATVVNKNGEWTTASFHGYGEQLVHEVELRLNSNTRKKVRATSNHRWILDNDQVVSTKDLTAGDRIAFVAPPRPVTDELDYRLGVVHGLIYGDGTAFFSQKRLRGYMIHLCADQEDLLPWFSDFPVCYPPSMGGDPVVQVLGDLAKTHELKQLPSPSETDEYLVGFVRGWIAADGSVSSGSQVNLCVNKAGHEWFSRVASRLGYVIQSHKTLPRVTNYGDRKHDAIVLYLSRSSLVLDDFLITRKRDRFKPLQSRYTVVGVNETDDRVPVFCAEVPDTNTFVLDQGLVTGNCTYVAINRPEALDEAMYLLMCGVGVGYSVESHNVAQLPLVPEVEPRDDVVIVVEDSKYGWARALRQLIDCLYSGLAPRWDTHEVRPAGSVLKTFGGRASGPGPLEDLFLHVVETFRRAAGRRLTELECHSVCCKIGDIVVVGGVRRSAMISLFSQSDQTMLSAKMGNWFETSPHLGMANNSAVYTERPEPSRFLDIFSTLISSKAGEPGIFNRASAQKQASRWGKRSPDAEYGVNPCGEIILRDMQMCNLSEAIARPGDGWGTLMNKIEIATIFGTLQSTLTDFKYLDPQWKVNCEDERLLGVSIAGIPDHALLNGSLGARGLSEFQTVAHEFVVQVNTEWARRLGIEPSSALTCLKPSGNTSQLVNASSPLKPPHAEWYVRRTRGNKSDPVSQLMVDQGVPHEDEAWHPDTTWVFNWPHQAPDGAKTRHDWDAIQHLELWKLWRDNWCDHNPSVTINVRNDEWIKVAAWVDENWDKMIGVAFLPDEDHSYVQAPYEEVSKSDWDALRAAHPSRIDWSVLDEYEGEDRTVSARELACSAGACEI